MSHAGKESLWPISQREKAPRLKSSEGEGQSRFGISHAYVNDPHNLLNRPLSAEYRTSVSGLLEQSVSRRREFYSRSHERRCFRHSYQHWRAPFGRRPNPKRREQKAHTQNALGQRANAADPS
jgi:hypothetical protein